jgi:hypothetical protein
MDIGSRASIWEQKITRAHSELADRVDAVLETVANSDHVEPDRIPEGSRFSRRDAGPRRWLLRVASYEQPGRIVTALANRRDPKQWTP